ncbi:MAG: hypothetical protein AAGJ35_15175 [Myxococcota bacterium]
MKRFYWRYRIMMIVALWSSVQVSIATGIPKGVFERNVAREARRIAKQLPKGWRVQGKTASPQEMHWFHTPQMGFQLRFTHEVQTRLSPKGFSKVHNRIEQHCTFYFFPAKGQYTFERNPLTWFKPAKWFAVHPEFVVFHSAQARSKTYCPAIVQQLALRYRNQRVHHAVIEKQIRSERYNTKRRHIRHQPCPLQSSIHQTMRCSIQLRHTQDRLLFTIRFQTVFRPR